MSSSPTRQSTRWRHSGDPYRVRFCDSPSRSEIVLTPRSSAVDVSSPTAFALENGVGGYAVRPLSSNSVCESSNACCAFAGTSSGGVLKNEVSAVDVYSG